MLRNDSASENCRRETQRGTIQSGKEGNRGMLNQNERVDQLKNGESIFQTFD
jgi:hypothetical protein